jgi:hypothetical protein
LRTRIGSDCISRHGKAQTKHRNQQRFEQEASQITVPENAHPLRIFKRFSVVGHPYGDGEWLLTEHQ